MRHCSKICLTASICTDQIPHKKEPEMEKLVVASDRLLEIYRIAEENCTSANRNTLLESDVVYAILAKPKSVVGITCNKLGLPPEMLKLGIERQYYPSVPYRATNIEGLAARYFSKLPNVLEMVLPEHVLFVLSRSGSFIECLDQLGLDSSLFASELYRRSGKDVDDYPDRSEWIKEIASGEKDRCGPSKGDAAQFGE